MSPIDGTTIAEAARNHAERDTSLGRLRKEWAGKETSEIASEYQRLCTMFERAVPGRAKERARKQTRELVALLADRHGLAVSEREHGGGKRFGGWLRGKRTVLLPPRGDR